MDFAASVYAEPGALGLIANIMAGLLVAVENMLNPPFSPMAQSLAGDCRASAWTLLLHVRLGARSLYRTFNPALLQSRTY